MFDWFLVARGDLDYLGHVADVLDGFYGSWNGTLIFSFALSFWRGKKTFAPFDTLADLTHNLSWHNTSSMTAQLLPIQRQV